MLVTADAIAALQESRLALPSDVTYDDIWQLIVVPECMTEWGAHSRNQNQSLWRSVLHPLMGHEEVRATTWRSAKAALMTVRSDGTHRAVRRK